jgi:hypothetical protein
MPSTSSGFLPLQITPQDCDRCSGTTCGMVCENLLYACILCCCMADLLRIPVSLLATDLAFGQISNFRRGILVLKYAAKL